MSACETGSLEQIYYRPSRPCCENCGAIVRDVKTDTRDGVVYS